MATTSIAAQLYTLREQTRTPADIARTLARVRAIGYEAVQLSALGPIDAQELARILSGEGLTCCATHTSLARMRDQTQQVIDELHLWGCEYTAIGGFNPREPKTQDWLDFAIEYNAIAGRFDGSGISIGYHNHSHELAHYDGKPALQILLEHLSPKVWIEIDTYWITHGGGDPAQWISKVAGKVPCIHCKDMGVTNDRRQFMAEVGEGNLNWPGILQAGREAGVRWYIVEQDDTNGKDPFECLATSLKNLREMGVT